ncbi:MAG: hypothetical protein IPJ14_11240 [Kineosporiaceae bacterium]|nr:hypothetical protein [Kineosporiaceae bacterium]
MNLGGRFIDSVVTESGQSVTDLDERAGDPSHSVACPVRRAWLTLIETAEGDG